MVVLTRERLRLYKITRVDLHGYIRAKEIVRGYTDKVYINNPCSVLDGFLFLLSLLILLYHKQ